MLELIHYTPLNLRGLSITLPHKENLVRLAREQVWKLDEPSATINAANTVSIERYAAGHAVNVEISNTDAPAIVQSVTDAAGPLQGKRIAILGAGGVARAAAHALSEAGAHIKIFNRTLARAQDLAQSVPDAVALSLSDLPLHALDILINCTPLGMTGGPAPDSMLVHPANIRGATPDTVVMDTIYNPLETPLLRAARESGLRPVSGLPMFIAQAAAQFSAWTSQPAPAQLFDRIAREHVAAT